jgi:hypothetical protein
MLLVCWMYGAGLRKTTEILSVASCLEIRMSPNIATACCCWATGFSILILTLVVFAGQCHLGRVWLCLSSPVVYHQHHSLFASVVGQASWNRSSRATVACDTVLCCSPRLYKWESVFYSFSGNAEVELRSNFENVWSVYLWRHNSTLPIYFLKMCEHSDALAKIMNCIFNKFFLLGLFLVYFYCTWRINKYKSNAICLYNYGRTRL